MSQHEEISGLHDSLAHCLTGPLRESLVGIIGFSQL